VQHLSRHIAAGPAGEKYIGGTKFRRLSGTAIGTYFPKPLSFSLSKVAEIKGVQTGPGAIAFTRIPLSANAPERLLVKATMAPFVLA